MFCFWSPSLQCAQIWYFNVFFALHVSHWIIGTCSSGRCAKSVALSWFWKKGSAQPSQYPGWWEYVVKVSELFGLSSSDRTNFLLGHVRWCVSLLSWSSPQ